jgi:hypothetical protein
MAIQYIVTQLQSIPHIVTRGFIPLITPGVGYGEIIELGPAHFIQALNETANVSRNKDYITAVTVQIEETATVSLQKELIAEVLKEPLVLVEL